MPLSEEEWPAVLSIFIFDLFHLSEIANALFGGQIRSYLP